MRRASTRARGQSTEGPRLDYSPFDEVSDFLQQHQNYFPELEEAAEALRVDFKLDRQILSSQLASLLKDRFGFSIEYAEAGSGSSVVRRLARA